MKITILSLARFLEYLQAVLCYKKEISRLFNCRISDIKRFYKEINNSEFVKEIIAKSNIKRGFFDFSMLSNIRAPTLYVISRILKPEIVVETGVCDGFYSAFILYALENNQKGHLYSIDLPNQPGQELKQGKSTGWIIPENLRHRWTLILGSSREKLPLLLNEIKNWIFSTMIASTVMRI